MWKPSLRSFSAEYFYFSFLKNLSSGDIATSSRVKHTTNNITILILDDLA